MSIAAHLLICLSVYIYSCLCPTRLATHLPRGGLRGRCLGALRPRGALAGGERGPLPGGVRPLPALSGSGLLR